MYTERRVPKRPCTGALRVALDRLAMRPARDSVLPAGRPEHISTFCNV